MGLNAIRTDRCHWMRLDAMRTDACHELTPDEMRSKQTRCNDIVCVCMRLSVCLSACLSACLHEQNLGSKTKVHKFLDTRQLFARAALSCQLVELVPARVLPAVSWAVLHAC